MTRPLKEAIALRDVTLGIKVVESGITIASGTSTTIFTVAGGRVLMTGIIGECITAVGASDNCKFTHLPTLTTAGDTDLCATADLNTCDVGDQISINGKPGDAILVAHKGSVECMDYKGVLLQEGTVTFDFDAETTGEFDFEMYYIPIDDGAYVTSVDDPAVFDLRRGQALRKLQLGLKVEKVATTVPQTTSGTLFTVAGGRILMTGIIGECTVAVGATDNIKLIANPTLATAADTDLCAAVDMNTCDVGDLLSITGAPGDNMLAAHKGSVQMIENKGIVLQEGTLDVHAHASTTGAFKWTMFYVALDVGAYAVTT